MSKYVCLTNRQVQVEEDHVKTVLFFLPHCYNKNEASGRGYFLMWNKWQLTKLKIIFSSLKKKNTLSTLSMSFQHFSTIFLSTTAGWWGWGGCWWGWKASFIKPMRPAPLLGFPAINSVGDRGLAPGLKVDNQVLLLTRFSTEQPLFLLLLYRT